MDFYTGKPERPIEHFGVICHTFQTSHQPDGLFKEFTDFLSAKTVVLQQSDEEALQTIEQLVLERQSNANLVYDMNISITHIPIQNNYCIITKIYASYGSYKD